jgi:L-amino acid N-acyltransferase YncA
MRTMEMTKEHYPEVKRIYLEGIATGQATFQSDAPEWAGWDKAHLPHSRIISLDDQDHITGWAALTPVSGRCVYAGVAEVSVYVSEKFRGKGIGSILLKELILRSEQNTIWTLQAGIFPENVPSMQLHQNNGFRIIGTREKIGQMNGKWRDTVLLERRSITTGI